MIDGAGAPVIDSLVEVWQAEFPRPLCASGGWPGSRISTAFGRTGTDETCTFRIETVKPGRVVGSDAKPQAPHLNVTVFARGMPNHAFTRIYFSDESSANEADMVLGLVDAGLRGTLIAAREETAGRAGLPLRRPSPRR